MSSSSSTQVLTPILYTIRCTANISPEEAVSTPAIKGTDVTTFRVNVSQFDRFAEPIRANAGSIVEASTWDTTAVPPPAITAQELAHEI